MFDGVIQNNSHIQFIRKASLILMFNPQFNTIVNNYKFKLNKNNNMAYIEISEYIKKAEKKGKI
jgi:hypothetical protein